ncbi:hypothetical protein [Microvirga flavescens]|uniref:hypothetical protein n=1 Tax=Microvirga flavescens TaxID=2249811 RepID=UPI000DDA6C53|nr:hypothetical protein [Microvirga flavescens]
MKRIEIALAFGAVLWALPATANDCRLPQPALGASTQQGDCAPVRKAAKPQVDERLKTKTPGFIDLGNGTQVRVSGRVRVDAEYRR